MVSNPGYFSQMASGGALTQVEDGVDNPHTGLIKALSLGMGGNYPISGFDATSVTASTATIANGVIFRDGSKVSITGGGITLSTTYTTGYHLLVARASGIVLINPTAVDKVPEYTSGDVVIGIFAYTGTNPMSIQYLSIDKTENSLSIGYDSGGYTEAGTITGDSNGISITGTSDVSLDGANDRVYIKDATDSTLKTVTVSSITGLVDLSSKEDLISGQTLTDLTNTVATGDELLVRDVSDSNNLKVVNASDLLSTLGYRDTDAVSAVEAEATLDLTGDVTIPNKKFTVDTTTLVVNAPSYTDKVGIGTATPTAELEVNGDVVADRITMESSQVATNIVVAGPTTTSLTVSEDYQIYKVSSTPAHALAITMPNISTPVNHIGSVYRIDCFDTYASPNAVTLDVNAADQLVDEFGTAYSTPIDLAKGQSYTLTGTSGQWILHRVNDEEQQYFVATVTSSTNDSTLNAGQWNLVDHWTVGNNRTMNVTTSSKFTAVTDGLYTCEATVGFISTNSTLPISGSSVYQQIVAIYKNGSAINRVGTTFTGSYSAKGIALSTMLDLSAGDYVEIYFFVRKEDDTSNTGTTQLRGGEYCRWTMRRVGGL